jgi:hypothetical protein
MIIKRKENRTLSKRVQRRYIQKCRVEELEKVEGKKKGV